MRKFGGNECRKDIHIIERAQISDDSPHIFLCAEGDAYGCREYPVNPGGATIGIDSTSSGNGDIFRQPYDATVSQQWHNISMYLLCLLFPCKGQAKD